MAENSVNKLQELLSRWQKRALDAEKKAENLETKINREVLPASVIKAVAAILAVFLMIALVVFFLVDLASSVSDISISDEDIPILMLKLDGSLWQTDNQGAEDFASLFFMDSDGTAELERLSYDTIGFSVSGRVIPVRAVEGKFSGSLNGVLFSLAISEDRNGNVETLTLVSGETMISFFPA